MTQTANANDLAGRASPGPPRRAGRWPPGGRRIPDPGPDAPGLFKVIGDLAGAIAAMTPRVLGSRTIALDANGTATGQERLPYRALAITSFSGSQLTVAAAPLAGNAPGPGPGVALIAPRGFRVINARAYAWSVYGGSAGELIDVETFALPQPPTYNSGTNLGPQASVPSSGQVTGPAAGAVIDTTGPLPAGLYQVQYQASLGGTTAAADASNMQLQVGATVYTVLQIGSSSGSTYGPFTTFIQVPAATALSINAIAIGTGTATYRGVIIATRVA